MRPISKYAKTDLLSGIFKKCKKYLTMRIMDKSDLTTRVPLSCFSRTPEGNIVLYRGLKNVPITSELRFEQSVAASANFPKPKLSRSAEINLARDYSGLTQRCDPVLHTTTSRRMAKTFSDNGILIEYHIPPKYVEENGIVGSLGENEIDFIWGIEPTFVKKVTKMKDKDYGFTKGLPKIIEIG